MSTAIGRDLLIEMLRGAARRVRANQEHLGRLDSFGGDGDHGATMNRAMHRLERALDQNPSLAPGDLLHAVGWAIMGADGGATGPLLGAFFMAMQNALSGDGLDAALLTVAFEAGLNGVLANTRARVGDKTLIDALTPAVAALRVATSAGQQLVPALECAALAAAAGARGTASLQARFGRAKHVGEDSVGHEDPGAVSVALMFQGLAEGARSHG